MANDLFKKAELQREAAKALIDYISSIERTEFISAPNFFFGRHLVLVKTQTGTVYTHQEFK